MADRDYHKLPPDAKPLREPQLDPTEVKVIDASSTSAMDLTVGDQPVNVEGWKPPPVAVTVSVAADGSLTVSGFIAPQQYDTMELADRLLARDEMLGQLRDELNRIWSIPA